MLYLRTCSPAQRGTTVHRHFAKWEEEAVILQHNAEVLLAQLEALSPEFVLCTSYHELPRLADGFEDFIFGGVRDEHGRVSDPHAKPTQPALHCGIMEGVRNSF